MVRIDLRRVPNEAPTVLDRYPVEPLFLDTAGQLPDAA
jgi:hypothetical protein